MCVYECVCDMGGQTESLKKNARPLGSTGFSLLLPSNNTLLGILCFLSTALQPNGEQSGFDKLPLLLNSIVSLLHPPEKHGSICCFFCGCNYSRARAIYVTVMPSRDSHTRSVLLVCEGPLQTSSRLDPGALK